jgi:succinate-semialdehyde dehydrogenase/glutarate-semialdehyde dehydrogenase
MPYQSVNPFNGQTLQTFPEITDVRLEAALATATACYAKWRLTSFAERAKIVAKAAAILHDRVDDFARPMTLEMGKRISEARGEVEFSSNILAYYAEHAERFLAPVKLHPKFGEAHMESSPLGLIFGVEPWNFPYYQLARIAGPHLMAGNVLLVKHAGCVPQCAIAFERLWIEAGGPAGLYTNLLISHDQSDQVVDDPRIKGVALTGSVAAGRSIAARAGKNLKVSSMELGGSDAFIVLEDADLEPTVKWAVWGRMYNTGQTCCAAKRFIVVESVADAFLAKFRAALAALTPGDPMDEKTTLGPLSTESALQDLLKQVDGAVAHGAKVVLPHRCGAREPRLPRRVLRTGRDVLPRQGRGRRHRARQRFRLRPGRFRVHQGCRAGQTRREPGRDGHDVHQQHQLVRRGPAVRRDQEFRLWARARGHGHPGIRQQEARAHRHGRRPGLSRAMYVNISVLKETQPNERRVALVPAVVPKLTKLGARLSMQTGAAAGIHLADAAFKEVVFVADRAALVAEADVVLAVQPPAMEVIDAMKPGAILISFIYAGRDPALVQRLRDRRITCFAMERVPRITRAQAMDALSSQAALAGYYAVQLGSTHLGRILPKITTAAGAIGPAKVLVMGLGVAGLEAIATAHRLGAVVEGYDVRPETQEQAESLGATFVQTGVDARGSGGYARELTAAEKIKVAAVLTQHIQQSDLIITTAAIPGRPSPKLISRAQAAGMKPGSVIVDLAADGSFERAFAVGRGCERTLRQESVQSARPHAQGQRHPARLEGRGDRGDGPDSRRRPHDRSGQGGPAEDAGGGPARPTPGPCAGRLKPRGTLPWNFRSSSPDLSPSTSSCSPALPAG